MKTKINVEVERGDITRANVDAIVNCSTTRLVIGGGSLDTSIHRAAGPGLMDECQKIIEDKKGLAIGECVITDAYKLPCKKVIHTVGPMFMGGGWNEAQSLALCYHNAMNAADEAQCESIAFPALCTGMHSYPKDEAAKIAVRQTRDDLKFCKNLSRVVFVCADGENFNALNTLLETH